MAMACPRSWPTPAGGGSATRSTVIAVDTNILVYAHRNDSPSHEPARSALEPLVRAAKVQGAAVHDARIAAICLAPGVAELWSADRDFARYPALKVHNPVVG
jgi:predicted nucleic acid-binding protein